MAALWVRFVSVQPNPYCTLHVASPLHTLKNSSRVSKATHLSLKVEWKSAPTQPWKKNRTIEAHKMLDVFQ
jgi:hypothetical protein